MALVRRMRCSDRKRFGFAFPRDLFPILKTFSSVSSYPDGSLTRSLHHQPSAACPHSHGNPQLAPQPPPQGDYVIPHTVTFHPPLPSHPPGHAVPPAPPPPLSTHHLSGPSAPLAPHLSADHQTLPHHMPALGASVQRLHQHEMLQRMEVQRRRMMQHPTWVQVLVCHVKLRLSAILLLKQRFPVFADEHTSVRLRTHTECIQTTDTDTTSTCPKLCLPTLGSPSKERHGEHWQLN